MSNDKKNAFEGLDGGEIVKSVEWKQDIAREKTKFIMKIRGKKVKWCKIKEEQNMRFEIYYNTKSIDLICTNLKDKK